MSNPHDVIVSSSGLDAWIADASNGRIAVWNPTNDSRTTWADQITFGSAGNSASQFSVREGIAVSPDQLTAWVVDDGNHRVSVWRRTTAASTDWAFQTSFGTEGSGLGQLQDPFDVAVSRDELTAWVADGGNDRISVWKRKSKSSTVWVNKTTFDTSGSAANQFREPRGIAVAKDGRTLFISDFGNHRASVWTYS